jgi:hypothetical protein
MGIANPPKFNVGDVSALSFEDNYFDSLCLAPKNITIRVSVPPYIQTAGKAEGKANIYSSIVWDALHQ